ncbi:EGF-like domain protein [Ancylostoma duodenale]|uniref:EGF-like domain protein n=1 Tax=Ancylostoma duodenale TaxID=51022 RepID=A0A0C2BGQ1_9BILA|nr:EGF-like domain protein [Ancylostoma duodenale]
MRPVAYFLLLFTGIQSISALGGHGLVNPQSACNIRCENGGMCAFSFDNPQFHTCICLMGVYEGDRCQYEGEYRMRLFDYGILPLTVPFST